MTVQKKIRIWGHVQGVSYRKQTRKVARYLGVNGWVRNVANGMVEACFDGSMQSVDALIAWCARGPRRGRVDRVQIVEAGRGGDYADFEIREDRLIY
jgi:acylphosphatase